MYGTINVVYQLKNFSRETKAEISVMKSRESKREGRLKGIALASMFAALTAATAGISLPLIITGRRG